MKNIDLYSFKNQNLVDAFEYISKGDFLKGDLGKIEINGENLYAVRANYMTKSKEESPWEAHRAYIDIHYIIEGEELVGYAPIGDMDITKEYDPVDDAVLGQADGAYIKMKSGDFVVFYPDDAHKPAVESGEKSEVKKLIVKVKI